MPFSNGSSYEVFKHNICEYCTHWSYDFNSETWGCPLMDLFFMYNYGAKGDLRIFIDSLCNGEKCVMFKRKLSTGQKRL